MEQSVSSLERAERWFVAVLAVWVGGAFLVASSNTLSAFPPIILAPVVAVETFAALAFYFWNDRFRSYIASIDLKHLTIFHLWRLLAGFTFVAYGNRHILPWTFVRNAGYGDIVVGVLVPAILLLPSGAGKYLTFHIIGLADFLLAVGTGTVLTRDPLMANLISYPVILIPLVGVPLSGALHVMALDISWRCFRKESALPAVQGARV